MPATSVNPIAYTGRVPTPADVVARYQVTLAYAGGLAEYHAAASGTLYSGSIQARYKGQGLASSVVNSTAAMAAAGGYSFGRQMGNANYPNCISAALAWHKAIVTSATGATMLLLPEGGNPPSSDTDWSSPSLVPANSPGVVAWSQVNGCLGESYIPSVLASLAAQGSWPAGGFVQTGGSHHPIGAFGSITPTNQTEVTLALQYFKTVIFGLSGDQMSSQWSGGSRFFNGLTSNTNDDHCFCACDCGPASTLAAAYGVSIPSGIASTAFCIAGITWGTFCVIDWASLLNVASEGWVIITDPDRADAATFNPVAQADYRTMCGTNGPYLAAAACSYQR